MMMYSIKTYVPCLYRSTLAVNVKTIANESHGYLDSDGDSEFSYPEFKLVACPPNSPDLPCADGDYELPDFSEDDDCDTWSL